jgi:hypothetical protein
LNDYMRKPALDLDCSRIKLNLYWVLNCFCICISTDT